MAGVTRESLLEQKHNSSRAPTLNYALRSLDFTSVAGRGFDRKLFYALFILSAPVDRRRIGVFYH